MHYKNIDDPVIKAELDKVLKEVQAELDKLKHEDHPKIFWLVLLAKDDKIFGRCIFYNAAELNIFKENYEALQKFGKWGFIAAEIVND
jgi:hypothetical protein